jgi:hypothetical protein
MAEQASDRIQVNLRWIQILDKMEPFFKEKGEFRFYPRVSSDNRGGIVQEKQIPEQGFWAISDHPAWNKVDVNRVIFEGEVDDHLIVELFGEELDSLTANDQLDHYRREFTGPVASMLGWYAPGEDIPEEGDSEARDPENMPKWRVCYTIERA